MEAFEIVSEGYVLPPRSNRGVPPKRYSPEKESRRCKYPVANIAEGNLSKGAKAFISSLYSNEVPTTIEQALKSRQWRKATEFEMKDLGKLKYFLAIEVLRSK
nr:putative ribonuclease H-like domain-containing protein [Tanacetum cinerariifolium]